MLGHFVRNVEGIDAAGIHTKRAFVNQCNLGTDGFENAHHHGNIADRGGNILNNTDIAAENGSGNYGNSGIFCAADIYGSVKCVAAVNDYLFHFGFPTLL